MARARAGITVVGRDRGGVVAAFTGLVFKEGGNVEQLSQNVAGGLFGMHLEASFPARADLSGLPGRARALAARHGMEADVHRETPGRKSIAVLVTREPHCLRALLRARGLNGRVSVVAGTEEALRPQAERAGVPFELVRGRSQEDAESELLGLCRRHSADLVVLARYMRILTPNFVWRYPNRIINIHPSLLPAFPGASAYAQAFERGAKVAGVTAHYVTEGLDQGPIIRQEAFRIGPGQSLDEVRAAGQRLEASVLLRAVRAHLRGGLEVRWGRVHERGAGRGGRAA